MIKIYTLLIVGLSVCCMPMAIAAKDGFDWEPLTKKDWDTSDFEKNNDAVILFEKIISDERKLFENQCYLKIYRRVKIINYNGRWWGNVQVPIIHQKQKIAKIAGRTIYADGREFYLSREQILQNNAYKTEEMDIKQISINMPGVTEGSIIEYYLEYEIPEPNQLWLFQKELPLVKGEYKWILYRSDLSPKFQFDDYFKKFTSSNNIPSDLDQSSSFNRQNQFINVYPEYIWLHEKQSVETEFVPSEKKPEYIVFKVENVPAFEKEPMTFPEIALKYQLRCHYVDGTNEKYWEGVAKNTTENLEKYFKPKNSTKAAIAQFTKIHSDSAKIHAVYSWLQNNIKPIDFDDQKRTYKTNQSVDDVLKRGYGTNSDINYAFYFILKELNIDTRMAYVVNRTRDFFWSETKSHAFNQNLVAVGNGTGSYDFFSPGDLYLPSTQVPWYVEGTKAFLLNGRNYEFHDIPFSDAKANVARRVVWLKIDKNFYCVGAIFQTYKGHQARSLRLNSENLSDKQWQEMLQNEFAKIFPDFSTTTGFVKINETPIPNVNQFSKITFSNSINLLGMRLLINPTELMTKITNPFHAQTRQHPIIFDYAYDITDVLHIELPLDWHVEALPQQFSFTNEVGKCMLNFVVTGNLLSVQHLFRLNNPFWPASQYDQVRELFRMQQTLNQFIAVLNIGDKETLSLIE